MVDKNEQNHSNDKSNKNIQKAAKADVAFVVGFEACCCFDTSTTIVAAASIKSSNSSRVDETRCFVVLLIAASRSVVFGAHDECNKYQYIKETDIII